MRRRKSFRKTIRRRRSSSVRRQKSKHRKYNSYRLARGGIRL